MDTTKLLFLIRACTGSNSLKQGKLLHQKVISLGLQNNIILCKSLISLYFSCHSFESAKRVFRTVENPFDVSLWNGLISAYTKNSMFVEALDLFERLLCVPNLKPDSYTYPSVLKACNGLRRSDYGKAIHTLVMKSGFVSDVVIASSIVGMYAKCDLFVSAVQLFDEMPERDIACWNNVISCYYQNGQYEKALDLFETMKNSGFAPDSVTFTTVVSSCTKISDFERAKEIHMELLRNGHPLDAYISGALVSMYGKSGDLEMAKTVFEQIPRKSLASWNSMMTGYSVKGDSKSCIQLFVKMNLEGIQHSSTTYSTLLMACSKSTELRHGKLIHGYIIRNSIQVDTFVSSSLVDLYFKCGRVSTAENVFRRMQKIDEVVWNVMISGYISAGCYFEALSIYNEMKKAGIKPGAITFTSVLTACTQLTALEQGKDAHKSITAYKLESNNIVMSALLDMYAKCGAVDEALKVFKQLPERDIVSWTSMISAYGSHGQALEAVNLFKEMLALNVKPDRITFLAVISACSHSKLVNEGCYYFNMMVKDYGIQPKIAEYSCLIDLLGRAGRVKEAYEILQRSDYTREDIGLLSTLFSACRLHKDSELGEKIGKKLIKKDPDDSSPYIILANMYASMKKWDEARKIRMKMKELGLKKNPGCSWIEVGSGMKTFLAEDNSMADADMVYNCLSILSNHMEEEDEDNILLH